MTNATHYDVPTGEYLATFEGVDPTFHSEWGVGLKWEFEVAKGLSSGRPVFRTTKPFAEANRFNSCGRFLLALTGKKPADVSLGDIDDFMGERFDIFVGTSPSGKYTRVESLTPANEAAMPDKTIQPLDIASSYLDAGLCVLPADVKKKFTTVGKWKRYQSARPTADDLGRWFNGQPTGFCLICGEVSGRLEAIDFDLQGQAFPAWKELIQGAAPDTFEKLVIESSQSGGVHVAYRSESKISGNAKLAERMAEGKKVCLIETRGQGGLILVAPSKGYELKQGAFTSLPVLTSDERDLLLAAAVSLDETAAKVRPEWEVEAGREPEAGRKRETEPQPVADLSPGDDFNVRGDVRALLENHGWKHLFASADGNQHFQRPGKNGDGASATFHETKRKFFVFSSNADPLKPETAYSPFALFAALECVGFGPGTAESFSAAASELRRAGFGRGADGEKTDGKKPPDPKPAMKAKRVEFSAMTCGELMAADLRLDYLIDGLLVAGQPCILAGPKKSLKTSLLLDLSLSLAVGGCFLGRFPVASERRVGIMTGESGLATIQETLRRIADAAGVDPSGVDGLLVTDRVPRFGVPAHDLALGRFIDANSLDVLIIDPAYMSIDGADAGNLFQMGAKLRSPAEVCQDRGATLVLAHHTRKHIGGDDPFRPPELEDISWSGFQEFARQWLLVSRRAHYEPGSGVHSLWLSSGGSAGHGGLHGVDVSEGTYPDRFWDVAVAKVGDVRQAETDGRLAAAEEAKAKKKREAMRDIVQLLVKLPAGETKKAIQSRAGLGQARFAPALAELLADGTVIETAITKNRQAYDGFKLADGNDNE